VQKQQGLQQQTLSRFTPGHQEVWSQERQKEKERKMPP
jgi:hypothetical protein